MNSAASSTDIDFSLDWPVAVGSSIHTHSRIPLSSDFPTEVESGPIEWSRYGFQMHDDFEFLTLTQGAEQGQFEFTVENHLARIDGHLYGGTAIAASIATAERVSQRKALWMTTQFIATAPPNERISISTEVTAPGRRTNQIRVTGTDPKGEIVFASLGATGHYRDGGLAGTFESSPSVRAPDAAAEPTDPFVLVARNAGIELDFRNVTPNVGFTSVVEFREAEILEHPDPGPGRVCIWVRRKDRRPVTPAIASYMADMVPLSVAHACGVLAGGISLDNSIRIGDFAESEWVLLDMRPHMAVGDYGHGAAHIWSDKGDLLATASQTASMMRFDINDLPSPPT